MKKFILNSAKGKRFFAELNGFFVGNNIAGDIDIYEYSLRVLFEPDFIVDNDLLCALVHFASRYNLLIHICADFNSVVVKFTLI